MKNKTKNELIIEQLEKEIKFLQDKLKEEEIAFHYIDQAYKKHIDTQQEKNLKYNTVVAERNSLNEQLIRFNSRNFFQRLFNL